MLGFVHGSSVSINPTKPRKNLRRKVHYLLDPAIIPLTSKALQANTTVAAIIQDRMRCDDVPGYMSMRTMASLVGKSSQSPSATQPGFASKKRQEVTVSRTTLDKIGYSADAENMARKMQCSSVKNRRTGLESVNNNDFDAYLTEKLHLKSASHSFTSMSNNDEHELNEIIKGQEPNSHHMEQHRESPSTHNRQPSTLCSSRSSESAPSRAVFTIHGTTLARYRRLVGGIARKALNQINAGAVQRVIRYHLENRQARKIQAAVRAYHQRVLAYRQVISAALVLQCMWRSHVAKQMLHQLKARKLKDRRIQEEKYQQRISTACYIVQKSYRWYLIRKRQHQRWVILAHAACRKIQVAWRRHQHRSEACISVNMNICQVGSCSDTTISPVTEDSIKIDSISHAQAEIASMELKEGSGHGDYGDPQTYPDSTATTSVNCKFECIVKSVPVMPFSILGADLAQPTSSETLNLASWNDSKHEERECNINSINFTQETMGDQPIDDEYCASFDTHPEESASIDNNIKWLSPVNDLMDNSGDRTDTQRMKQSCVTDMPPDTYAEYRLKQDNSCSGICPENIMRVSVVTTNNIAKAVSTLTKFIHDVWLVKHRINICVTKQRRHAAVIHIQCALRQKLARQRVHYLRKAKLLLLRKELQHYWQHVNPIPGLLPIGRYKLGDSVVNGESAENAIDDEEDDDDQERGASVANFAVLHAELTFLPTRNGKLPPGVEVSTSLLSTFWRWNRNAETWTTLV